MIDQQAIVLDYQTDVSLTTAGLATKYGVTPAQASAILHLNGVAVRRGNPNGPPVEARQRAASVRQAKALTRMLRMLVEKNGYDVVSVELSRLHGEADAA